MDWKTRLTPLASGAEPDEEHGFVTVRCEGAAQLNAAASVVEPAGWVLRVHYLEAKVA